MRFKNIPLWFLMLGLCLLIIAPGNALEVTDWPKGKTITARQLPMLEDLGYPKDRPLNLSDLLQEALILVQERKNSLASGKLAKMLNTKPAPELVLVVKTLLAELYYEDHLFELAKDKLLEINPEEQTPFHHLRLAELFFFHFFDRESALVQFRHIKSHTFIQPRNITIFQLLKQKLLLTSLDLKTIGLTDNNVSALIPDANDLWIGTWNGGLARLDLATGQSLVVRKGEYQTLPTTLRAIAVSRYFVYAAAPSGILRYSKTTGTSKILAVPSALPMERIQAIQEISEGSVLVAALGQGLWHMARSGQWTELFPEENSLKFATSLEILSAERILVGTMSDGARQILFDGGNFNLSDLRYQQVKNITFTKTLNEGTLLGSYGEGVAWIPNNKGAAQIWKKETGNLPDNWVMCSTFTGSELACGTLGGGVFFVSPQTGKAPASGELGPKDISAIASLGNLLVLGTLGEGIILWER